MNKVIAIALLTIVALAAPTGPTLTTSCNPCGFYEPIVFYGSGYSTRQGGGPALIFIGPTGTDTWPIGQAQSDGTFVWPFPGGYLAAGTWIVEARIRRPSGNLGPLLAITTFVVE